VRHERSTIQKAKIFQNCVQETNGSRKFQMLINITTIQAYNLAQANWDHLQWSVICNWLRFINMLGVKHSFFYFRQICKR